MAGMRTSRISDQTSKLVQALAGRTTSPRGGVKVQQRRSPSASISTNNTSALRVSKPPPPPSTPNSLKRKRGDTSTHSPSITKIMEETTSTRISPRRAAANAEDKPKKARRQPAKKVKGEDGDVIFEPPPNWEEVYKTTQRMRSQILAPVDTMGCESLAEDTRSPRDRRFQTLVALMLSSQTKDTVTAVAMKNLQDDLPGGFTLESILAVDPVTLNELISKVGFHNNKTKFIKATAENLRDRHNSEIPDTIEGLIALPGVGPKMAYLCMSAAWGRDEGIGVDVHVHRITNLWGWHKTSTPEETRAILESWLPKDKWHDINHLLVGFGQTWCPPVGRKCDECHLSAKGLCPSAVVGKKVKQRVKKEVVSVKVEDDIEKVVKKELDMDLVISPVEAQDLPEDAEDLQADNMSPAKAPKVEDIEDLGGRRRSRRLAP